MQIESINYRETFSPTAKICSIRKIIQLVAQFQHRVSQMDFKSAYLNAEIDCGIYVERPKEFIKKTSMLPDWYIS